MKSYRALLLLVIFILIGCNSKVDEAKISHWKQEIRDTERAFSKLSEREGVAKAFLTYAAEDAVLMRNNKLIKGYEAIRQRFEGSTTNANRLTLTWEPDFVEVSKSGDLGYTYGRYTLISKDSLGNETTNSGVFHTVWKRQEDGSWKFVWD